MDISYILTRKIQQLSHRIVLRRNEDLKSMGLTAEQADTLLFFHAHSGSSASDLRCSLGVTHQAARALVQRMADKGLLCVTPSPREHNADYLDDATLLEHIPADDREKLLAMISQALDNMEK